MRRWIYGLLLVSLAGCVKLPAPWVSVPRDYLYGEGFDRDSLPYDVRWWERFGDTTLNRLEETALAGNLDLAEAASRVEAARKSLAVSQAAWLPSVGLELSGSGGHDPGEGSVEHYGIAPALSWELSLFGALRATRQEAKAAIRSSEWAFRGVVLSLTAQVATAYFTLLKYEQGFSIAEHTYALRQESAALVDSLYRYGMASGIAREQARSLVYTAKSDCEQYRRLVDQTVLSLAVLLGENPRRVDTRGWGGRLKSDRLPEDIPVGLPSDLLSRRPDIMEALFEADQAAARVGLARAARFPSISLTATGGVVSSSLRGLTSGDPWTWSLGGSLVQPIFAFGKLKRQEQVARENYYEALFGYEQSILQALSEVESALVGITGNRAEIEQNRNLVAANEAVAYKTRALYRNGMSAYLDVIDAERSLYESELSLLELTAGQYLNYVSLIKALGGGW